MVASIGALARSTGIEIASFNVAASTTITKGKLVALNASGHAVLATNSVGTVARGKFVAIETVNKSEGDISMILKDARSGGDLSAVARDILAGKYYTPTPDEVGTY